MPWNFSFVIPGQLAGLACPGSQAPLAHDLKCLAAEGIGALVSLTRTAPDPEVVRRAGLEPLHLPVEDFTPPTLAQIRAFVEFARGVIGAGRGVAVHCAAGQGRTGTMLACYLVSLGLPPGEAVDSVRTLRPGSIETPQQEARVREYARERRTEKESPDAGS